MHLAVALEGAGWHPAAWREPGARPAELFTARYWADLVVEAERGLLDFVTFEDSLSLQSADRAEPDDRTDQVRGRLDAVLTAARVAPLTRHVGLIPAVTVTHTEPFHVSKAIATRSTTSAPAGPVSGSRCRDATARPRTSAGAPSRRSAWAIPVTRPRCGWPATCSARPHGKIYDLDVVGRPDTFTVLAALAAVTDRLGLAGTINSTFNEPYEVARQFATLDHLSAGRAAWNVVTSWDAFTGENFRRGGFLPQEQRYERAKTFLRTAWELFDSWQGGEILADRDSGIFLADPAAGRFAHRDAHFDIAGRFDVPRSPQGGPVIFQAGDSDEGREFAASSADAIFSRHSTLSRSLRRPRPPSGSARGRRSSATARRCPPSRSSASSTRSTPAGSTSGSAVPAAGRRARPPSPRWP